MFEKVCYYFSWDSIIQELHIQWHFWELVKVVYIDYQLKTMDIELNI